MRNILAIAALAIAAVSQAQIDDITKRMMSPNWGSTTPTSSEWGTVLVGAHAPTLRAGNHVISSYDQWRQMWPYLAGQNYQQNRQIPGFIDWNREQIVVISLGNIGVQGYGLYVENVRRVSSWQFDINYVITQPNMQAGVTMSSFNYGTGTSPYIVLRVPRTYGLPNFNSRYYQPTNYVVRHGCSCGACSRHGQVWQMQAGGSLVPYVPPGQEKNQENNGRGRGNGRGNNRGG